MIETVSISSSTYQKPPYKFEAGTPAIAEVIGLGKAVTYLGELDRKEKVAQETLLVNSAVDQLSRLPRIQLIGTPKNRMSVISFLIEDTHPHDVGQILDQQGVAVRSGHHCTMPLMNELQIPGTVRASFSLYSNARDVTRLIESVEKAADLL